jgi:hypothetical protein
MIESPVRTPRQQQLDSVTLRTWVNERAEWRGLPVVELFTHGVRETVNLRLSSVCADGGHHLCNGAHVALSGADFWSCACLCHRATAADREACDAERADETNREASGRHTLATMHETWSWPGIGWTCADPTCYAYNAGVVEAIEDRERAASAARSRSWREVESAERRYAETGLTIDAERAAEARRRAARGLEDAD